MLGQSSLTMLACAMLAVPAMAQHAPYAAMRDRPVKSLLEQQLDDLRAGRGMGLALAADTHLHTTDALTPAQIQLYAALRGYAAAPPAGHRHRH